MRKNIASTVKNNFFDLFSLRKIDQSRDYYLSLNGIRGMAFLFVLLSHMCSPGGLFFKGIGIIGVWLFFVMSSFLLTNYFIVSPQKSMRLLEWLNYFIRRFMRVYPLYFIIVTLFFLVNYLIKDYNEYFKHILLQEGSSHFWSIPAEMGYYLILPIMVFYILAIKRDPILSLITLILVIFVHSVYFNSENFQMNTINTLQYLPVFVTGSILTTIQFYILNKNINSKTIMYLFEIIGFLILGVIFLTFPSIRSFFVTDIPDDILHTQFVLFGLLWGGFILCVLNGKGYLRRFFQTPFLLFLGKISFSAYLIHPIFISLFYNIFSEDSLFAMVLIVLFTVFFSSVSYILIERPCMKFTLQKNKRSKITGIYDMKL